MNLLEWFKNKTNIRKKDLYPNTVAEVLDDKINYKKETIDAIKELKKENPWNGTLHEMQDKIKRLNIKLANAYNIEPPQIVFVTKFAFGCCYFPIGNIIVMEQEKDGRYSIVTFLHEFGHALGKNEIGTCKWSINLFRKYFPKSFSKLEPKGHLLFLPREKNGI